MISMSDENTAALEQIPERAKRYSRSRLGLGILKLLLGFVFLLVFLLSGVSEGLYSLLAGLTNNYYLQLSWYLLAFLAIYSLVFFPLDYYSDVVLEHRYGLSNQTTVGWLGRSVKQWVLSALMVVVGFNLLYRLIRNVPQQWWLFAAVGWFVLLVLISKITPAVLVPLFYKLRPLTDRELAERLRALADRCGVPVKRIQEIKLSKETKKANAAVVGLGSNRRILIGDTLMDLCTHDEIEAVFAHELGHVALHHSWKLLGIAAAGSVIVFYALFRLLNASAVRLGFTGADDIAAIPLLLLWVAIFGLIGRPLQAAWSRHLEKQADLFILGRVENPQSLISALAKLARLNLADPKPHPLVEFLFYDHPSIAKRIAYLQQAASRRKPGD
jgi:STE24 endopeptidase